MTFSGFLAVQVALIWGWIVLIAVSRWYRRMIAKIVLRQADPDAYLQQVQREEEQKEKATVDREFSDILKRYKKK